MIRAPEERRPAGGSGDHPDRAVRHALDAASATGRGVLGTAGAAVAFLRRHVDRGALRTIAPVASLTLVLVLFGAVLMVQWSALEQRRALVDASQAVMLTARSVGTAILEAESGQRGFVITGDERYLAPYHVARRELPTRLAELRAAVTVEPERRARVARIDTLVHARLDRLETGIAFVRAKNEAGIASLISGGRGRALMDAIRGEIDAFVEDERRRLEARLADVSLGEASSRITILAGFLAAAGGLLASLFIVLRTNARLRQEAELQRRLADDLAAARDELARRFGSTSAELADTAMRLEAALRGSRIVIAGQDRDLRYHWVRNSVDEAAPASWLGRTDAEIIPEPQRGRMVAAKLAVIETGEPASFEINMPQADGGDIWFDVHVEPSRRPDGGIDGVTSVAVDITERRRREQHIRLLMRELAHRSKNTLAVVQAMARQTAASASTKDDFVTRFEARLEALGAAHSLLVNEGWSGARIGDLVRSQLGHCLDLIGKQIFIEGPQLTLPLEMIQNIGLALHELATNAAKYGALSTPHGRVDIDWTVSNAADEPRVVIRWIESDGPPVEKPTRRGFGRIVIERTVARAVGGSVDLDYDRAGLRWILDFPLPPDAAGEQPAA